jgi:hypothetical protein
MAIDIEREIGINQSCKKLSAGQAALSLHPSVLTDREGVGFTVWVRGSTSIALNESESVSGSAGLI